VDSNDLRAALIASGQFEEPHSYPAYLAQYHWAPSFVLRHAATRLIVGFEVVYVDILPRRILAEAGKANSNTTISPWPLQSAGVPSLAPWSRTAGSKVSAYGSSRPAP
jgi:hypothetical protein